MEGDKVIKLVRNEKGFKLYFKEQLVLYHDINNPCIKIGKGSANYKLKGHKFRIRGKLTESIPLKKFEIIENSEEVSGTNKIGIRFNEGNLLLELLCEVKNEFLEISLNLNDPTINRFWLTLGATPEEAIFGCGARFEDINLKGKKICSWVEDCSPVFRDYYTYFPLPTFISSECYFYHVDTYRYNEFDFSNHDHHQINVWGIPKKILLGKFTTLIELINKLSSLFGRQPNLPEWVFDGLILGIQGGKEIVKEKIEKARQSDIKICAAWCQDWQGIRMTSFGQQLFWNWKYNESRYPNLPKFIDELNKKGIKFLGYINPQLNTEGEQYKKEKNKDLFLKNENGEDCVIYTTDFPVVILDLNNPKTIGWIKSVVKNNMLGIGLSGWMADYGEYVPIDSKNHLEENSVEFHNKYPVLFAKLMYELLKEQNKLSDIFYFHRSGYIGSSKYMMCYWPGDQLVDWDQKLGLPSVIPCAINLGMCGIGHYCFDIGGFTTYGNYKRSKELFMRWAELSAFTLIMRTHEGNRPKENWQFDSDKETLTHLSIMVKIHSQLKPYLKHLVNEYQSSGLPPIRGIFMHYPDDETLYQLKYQYMLGRDLLIAPVIKPNLSKGRVYLPDDTWIHLWTKLEFKKGWHDIDAPLGKPLVFYRYGSDFSNLFNEISSF